MEKEIDLRDCSKGDILISSLGGKLKYIEPLPEDHYYDHLVEYIEAFGGESGDKIPVGSQGTRTHDGYVFRKNRIPETDHDIVKIVKQ